MDPILSSRKRVRQAMEDAMVNRVRLRDVWGRVQHEQLFDVGNVYRERNDGELYVMS